MSDISPPSPIEPTTSKATGLTLTINHLIGQLEEIDLTHFTLSDRLEKDLRLVFPDPHGRGGFFVIRVEGDEMSIGSSKDSAIHLDDASVAESHAVLRRTSDGRIELVDLDSEAGCFLNERKVTQALVSSGDKLRFGTVHAVAQFAGIEVDLELVHDRFILALRRLEAASAHLQRIEEFDRTKHERETHLRELESAVQWTQAELNELQPAKDQLESLRANMRIMRSDLESLQKALVLARHEHARLDRESACFRDALERFSRKENTHEAVMRNLERTIAKRQAELNFFNDRIEQARREKEELEEEIQVQQDFLERLGSIR